MSYAETEMVQDLLRRIDEVRGLSEASERVAPLDPSDNAALLRALGEVVDELERSHRRLIETNIQLVSLREVASSLVLTQDVAETTRTVTRYLCRAYGLEEVFLLLADRDSETLQGTWTSRHGDRDRSVELEIPLRGDNGSITRAFWLHRAMLHHSPGQTPPLTLAPGHQLEDTLSRLDSTLCVPLQRSNAVLPSAEPHELCGARCMMGDTAALVPPPGPAAEVWADDREERQRHCLSCDLMPLLGVIGIARRSGQPEMGGSDVQLLESIGLSVSPIIENARLYLELRKSQEFREHVLDSMASALVAVNMRGEILTFNRAAEELLEFTEAELIGQPFGDRFGTDGHMVVTQTLEHGQEIAREEVTLRDRVGTPVPVSLSTSLLRNERRNVYGAIATFVDLRPLKRAEEHARRLDRLAALGRFTSSVAHEIRNPLTGIATGVQFLERGMKGESPQREHVDFILREIKRLDRIVQDLFDITHPRGLQPRVEPLENTVGRAVQVLRGTLEEKGITVKVTASPRTPAVPHDGDQIEQVFINLVKNAAEASSSGQAIDVTIQPGAPPAKPHGGLAASGAVVRVRDHGSGITPEHLKTIFEPFFTTKQSGTGLGLYICHDIVKRHGGQLSVQSEAGHGTTFTVELPLEIDGGTP